MWETKRFNKLTVTDLYQILALRAQIFVVDQQRIYQDPDGHDQKAIHIFNRDEDGDIVAYARVFLKGNEVSFGRVVTSNKVRGQGLGGQLLDKIMQTIQQEFPNKSIEIEAQVQVEDFYKRVGFVSEGEPFIYKTTPHIKMVHEAM